jgi:hypothetical protein
MPYQLRVPVVYHEMNLLPTGSVAEFLTVYFANPSQLGLLAPNSIPPDFRFRQRMNSWLNPELINDTSKLTKFENRPGWGALASL